MGSFFLKIYRFFKARLFLFGVVGVLLFAGLVFIASKIVFEEDISKLIPTTSENEQLQKVLNTANFSDKIIVNISKEDNGFTEALTQYATIFLDSISRTAANYIKDIQGQVDEDTALETLDFVYTNLPLFLSEGDYQLLEQKLAPDSIQKITKNNYNTIVSPTGIIAKKIISKDPLGVSLLGVQQLKKIGIGNGFKLQDGFLITEDEQNLLLFISPSVESSESSKNEKFSETLYNLQSQLNSQFKDEASSQLYGGTLIAVANAQQIKKDIQLTLGIALVVLLVLFIGFYRNLLLPVILCVPTLFGALVAIAVLYVIRDDISAISLGIGSVLLGVTLDYSLHILTHIRNGESIESLFTAITKPILMSSLTTALAFLCLLFIDSQALQDLGVFAAVSVLSASCFALIFIPQLYKGTHVSTKKTTTLEKFSAYKFHSNKWIIGGLTLAILISVFTYQKVVFTKDLSQLNYQTSKLKQAEADLDKLINTSSKSLYVTTYSDTLEAALQANDLVFKQLDSLQSSNSILSYNSIGALVHSKELQHRKIKRWDTFWTLERKIRVKENLIDNGATFGFKPTTHDEFYRLLETNFQPMTLSEYKELDAFAIDDFISSTSDFTTITSVVKVSEENIEAVKKVFNDKENVLVIDRVAMNESLLGNLKEDFNALIFYCFGIVVLLLLFFYRNSKHTLITIIPIALTWLLTVGLMGVLSLEFNIFNVIVTTFIFGLGVDYSIFMTNGLIHKENPTQTLKIHKTSILLSVITTLCGVGVLLFAKHPALQSVAAVSIIGIFTAMLITFTIQPLLYHFLIFKGLNKEE
ncbi:MMPL family transporter [Jejudonia soesokkakensis]|uniref:MMPL family transporter n=1 Tax=Jejudonia soesokkakensis TaxID=1323432 RepID=A0ABW2MWN3_9FLAO